MHSEERLAEVRHAHDVVAEAYADGLRDALAQMPVDRAMLGLFADLVLDANRGIRVCDVGCGPGRLEPFLAKRGLDPFGVDLAPRMVEAARRGHPDYAFELADVRALPIADASLAGVVCWYSLMYLAPEDRPSAYAELARVVVPDGHLAMAFKAGDDARRRGGRGYGPGVEFDVYWTPPAEVARLATEAGFDVVFQGGRPAEAGEGQPQGFLIARLS